MHWKYTGNKRHGKVAFLQAIYLHWARLFFWLFLIVTSKWQMNRQQLIKWVAIPVTKRARRELTRLECK